jgi:TPR repeat protein
MTRRNQKNKQKAITRAMCAGVSIVDEPDGADIEVLLTEVRCSKQSSWDALVARGLKNGNKLALATIALCWVDREISLIPANVDMGQQFARCILPWLKDRCETLECKYAQYLMGEYYFHGIAVEHSTVDAIKLFMLSADQGCASSQFRSGMCLEGGLGIQVDKARALDFYQQAAEKMHPGALNSLGWCYQSGAGVQADSMRANTYLRTAADLGFAAANYNLGKSLYDAGHRHTAWTYLLEAVRQGFAEAQNFVADSYDLGVSGLVARDDSEAARLWRLAAEQGHVEACYQLAVKLNSATNPLPETVTWMQKAACGGSSLAQRILGSWYEAGHLTSCNTYEAVRLYRLSAAQGLPTAIFSLGRCYKNGTGVSKDYLEAIRLFKLASDEGNSEARDELDRLNRLNW